MSTHLSLLFGHTIKHPISCTHQFLPECRRHFKNGIWVGLRQGLVSEVEKDAESPGKQYRGTG